ncbi:MAG: pyridoxine 5'-phosphate synthase [Bacteroidales bacterium]|jgi:pyridoxine 5-phosphate synthase|nr:pyridoxine 5'-phosphate synthase [Bacteroidales bacterium]MDD3755926.1 pyridoxine 5'-phosphate synthase [Bacteroidales bacterium]MDY0400149.1 pyridoxine 5'-phosphate synthase [Bacteroidales bacterium]HOB77755.1 pyridoxine 5'-phosphate synthase [Bacteroidales bacterium]HPZ61086.1 pyridoxine 5'-phosphate synthase [Bacteroidales bacterium]
MARLSVNINKVATLRNARGGNIPDVTIAAINVERFGAHGVTVHPRPDERHIKYTDVYSIKKVINIEFNIEGYPNDRFLKLVKDVRPTQVTLVPDPPDALTSNAGWDTFKHFDFLSEVIKELKDCGIRTSIFVETDLENIKNAAKTGTDRVELYTEPYAKNFNLNRQQAIKPFIAAANVANQVGLGINAGHDLNLDNLRYFSENIPNLLEVSIGHALISDSLYFGLENTIQMYLNELGY